MICVCLGVIVRPPARASTRTGVHCAIHRAFAAAVCVCCLVALYRGADHSANDVQVPGVGLLQIFLAVGALEYKMHDGKLGADTMFEGGRAPGDFGWDPLGTRRTKRVAATSPHIAISFPWRHIFALCVCNAWRSC
jgi:hypothetical protein